MLCMPLRDRGNRPRNEVRGLFCCLRGKRPPVVGTSHHAEGVVQWRENVEGIRGDLTAATTAKTGGTRTVGCSISGREKAAVLASGMRVG
jgi:hypothetical protein